MTQLYISVKATFDTVYQDDKISKIINNSKNDLLLTAVLRAHKRDISKIKTDLKSKKQQKTTISYQWATETAIKAVTNNYIAAIIELYRCQ